MNEKTVNQRLVKLIQVKTKSENAFAEAIGIAQGTLNNYVRLNRVPSLEVIIKILTTFPDISPDWLLLGIGPMYREPKTQTQDIVLENTNVIQKGRNNVNASSDVTIQENSSDSKDAIIQRLLDQNMKLLELMEKQK